MAGGWSFGRAARDCAGSVDGAGSVNSQDDQLFGIATTGGGAFAVGDDQDGRRFHSLIEHFGEEQAWVRASR